MTNFLPPLKTEAWNFIKFMLLTILCLAVALLIADAFLNTLGFNIGIGDALIAFIMGLTNGR